MAVVEILAGVASIVLATVLIAVGYAFLLTNKQTGWGLDWFAAAGAALMFAGGVLVYVGSDVIAGAL